MYVGTLSYALRSKILSGNLIWTKTILPKFKKKMCDHSAYFVIVKKTFDVLYPVLTFIFKMYVITYCLCLNRLSISTAKCTASFKESNSVQYMKKQPLLQQIWNNFGHSALIN